MALFDELQSAIHLALKSGDTNRVRTLRTLLAKLQEKTIEKKKELARSDIIKVLQTAAKQRKEATDMYNKAGRNELAEAELNELAIIEEYLPEQLSEDALVEMIDSAISDIGAESLKDMGEVMPVVMKKVAGQADGKTVQELVKKRLSS